MRDPFWHSDNGESTVTLYQGDVLEVLREMPAESVQCVITSPPYFGLRDYGTATWEGGGQSFSAASVAAVVTIGGEAMPKDTVTLAEVEAMEATVREMIDEKAWDPEPYILRVSRSWRSQGDEIEGLQIRLRSIKGELDLLLTDRIETPLFVERIFVLVDDVD